MEVRISDAVLDDPAHARGLVELLDGYASEPAGGSRPLSDDVRARLIPALRAQEGAVILLALADERPVGAAVCFRGFSTFAARPLLNVHDLAVLPDYRGRGIGRALLAAVEDRARKLGCCKLTLEVQSDNAPARALYRSAGFGDFAPGAEPKPTLFLEKRVDGSGA